MLKEEKGWESGASLVTADLPSGSSSCTASFHTGSMWMHAKHHSEVTLMRYGLLWLSGRTSLLNCAWCSRYLLSAKSLDLEEGWKRASESLFRCSLQSAVKTERKTFHNSDLDTHCRSQCTCSVEILLFKKENPTNQDLSFVNLKKAWKDFLLLVLSQQKQNKVTLNRYLSTSCPSRLFLLIIHVVKLSENNCN